jgi:hypothetical protein
MNKTLKLALSAVLGVALVSPALAQDNFPDVPENHWAYQALKNLKDKVLFGYPDGFYRGTRMTSRYELAVALDKMWKAMQSQFDGVNSKIKALEGRPTGGTDEAMRKQLADLQAEVNGMKGWKGSIDTMQKLVREFEPQLQQLGVDVKAMKDEMADLKSRVETLENKTTAITIGVEANGLILAGHSNDDTFGLGHDGRIWGEGKGDYSGDPVGMDKDFNMFHEAYISIKGGKAGEPQLDAVMMVGNLFQEIGLAQDNVGDSFEDNTDTEVGFIRFAVVFDGELVGQAMSAQLGRVSHKVSPYLFQRPSFTKDYYKQDLRDNGEWIFDGGVVDFNFGAVKATVFGGNVSDRFVGSHSGEFSFIPFGSEQIDRVLGVQLGFPVGEMGGINLAYLFQNSDSLEGFAGASGPANRMNTYGADVNLKFGAIQFYGAYGKTVMSENSSNVLDDENTAWDVAVGFGSDKWGARVGYRTIESNYMAAGYWGRLGTWYNPTNVEGFNASLHFNPSEDLKIWGKFEMLSGNDDGFAGYLGEDDDATMLALGVNFKLSNFFDLGLKYENIDFKFDGATPDPFQRWYTLMLGYNMSKNSSLAFTYTYSDADGKGVGVPGQPGAGQFQGGLFGTQVKIKF